MGKTMRINKKQSIHALSAVALAWAFNANSIPIDSSGTWTDLQQNNGSVGNIDGLNSNSVTWGVPSGNSNAGPSGYTFTGVTGDAPLDATLFPIGDFTHNNFTIELPSITGANLNVSLNFTDESAQQDFSFFFEHTETPNSANPCAAGGNIPCPDQVGIPVPSSLETVTLMGATYELEIAGFSEDGGNTIISNFLTSEGQPNTATLFARLQQTQGTPVPEPSILGLMAVGLIGLWTFGLRRRKQEY